MNFLIYLIFIKSLNGFQGFNEIKNQMISSSNNCIKSFKFSSKTTCLVECNLDSHCLFVAYNSIESGSELPNCFLYNGTSNSLEKNPFDSLILYEKNNIASKVSLSISSSSSTSTPLFTRSSNISISTTDTEIGTTTTTTTTTTTDTTNNTTTFSTATATTSTTTVTTATTSESRDDGLKDIFDKFTLKASIATISLLLTRLCGFAFLIDGRTTINYLVDYGANRIITCDQEWKQLSVRTFSAPCQIIVLPDNSIFLTSDNEINKLDKNLKIINKIFVSGSYGLVYVSKTNKMAVVNRIQKRLIFYSTDYSMSQTDSFSLLNYTPWSIKEYNDSFYIGTDSSIVIVFEGDQIVRTFEGCNYLRFGGLIEPTITSMIINQNNSNAIFLWDMIASALYYSLDGTYKEKILVAIANPSIDPYFIDYDSKGNFVILSTIHISLYY